MALLLLAGCSYVDGVNVVVRRESEEMFKQQVETFIRAKGFGPVRPLEKGGLVLSLTPEPDKGTAA